MTVCGLEQCTLALGVELTAFLGLSEYSWGQTGEGGARETQQAHGETEARHGNAGSRFWREAGQVWSRSHLGPGAMGTPAVSWKSHSPQEG